MEAVQNQTTQALSTEFANLSVILAENSGLHDRAILAISTKLDEIQNIDFTTLDIQLGDTIDADLNALQAKGTEAVEINLQRRSPFTKRMDEVRSLFTGYENGIKQKVESIKAWRAYWNKEKYRRDQVQKAELQKALDKQKAETAYATECANSINNHYMAFVQDTIDRFNQAYNSKTIEEFDQYELDIKAYQPTFQSVGYAPISNPLLTADEMAAIRLKTETDVFPILGKDFVQKLTDERDRLIELIPSRIAELQRAAADPEAAKAAADRVNQETIYRINALKQEQADRADAIVATSENETLNNMLDAVAATPAIQLSKGTKIKRKYEVTSHKAFIAIIQWWVKTSMGLMTVEELNKKFSFMITAANKALNDAKAPETIEADGLRVVEDFTTRATAAK